MTYHQPAELFEMSMIPPVSITANQQIAVPLAKSLLFQPLEGSYSVSPPLPDGLFIDFLGVLRDAAREAAPAEISCAAPSFRVLHHLDSVPVDYTNQLRLVAKAYSVWD